MTKTTEHNETVLEVPLTAEAPILAAGAELKSSLALMIGSKVYLGASLGRLDVPEAYRQFLAEVEDLPRRHDVSPDVIAYDLHPEYAATRWALSQPARHHVGVQHHHAHIVAGMAENGLAGKVVGLACDGTGYGTDGTIWGGEILLCDFDSGEFQRAGFLRPFSLLGGDAAAIETYRPALGVLVETFGEDWPEEAQHLIHEIESNALTLAIARLGAPSARLPRTSSLGRLFDAAAYILELCRRNDTEAQAPIAVQQAAEECDSADPLPYELAEANDGAIVMDYRPMIRTMVKEAKNIKSLARAFHEGLANMLAQTVRQVCETANERRVVLSGGCFLNALLKQRVEELLHQSGCEVYTHRQLSPGDENVAVGQALVAAAKLQTEA